MIPRSRAHSIWHRWADHGHWGADIQPQFRRGAATADRDLHQAGTVLVPESPARRSFCEYARVGEHVAASLNRRGTRHAACTKASEQVAIMVTVNDLGKVTCTEPQ